MDKETIFAEALTKAKPEDRRQFLESACAGNVELRKEIEALLAAHDDAGSFLNKTPEAFILTADSGETAEENEWDDDAWRELLEPSDNSEHLGKLSPYEVMEVLGRGGFGIVLRAYDTKLHRVVAIKLLAPQLALTGTAVHRFLREARAAAAVSHNHVVAIHFIDDNSRPPMIVMEYVEGQSLQQKIDSSGMLDVKSILRIGMQTASGLAAAHQQGLVHRDIKPANILLENGIERVKLTDFGLARAVDEIGITRTGQITGTPQYMSPEQAQGKRVDHRTDLFSLGCVLYAMCTGRAAFRAESAMAVMNRVVNDTPRSIRELNPEIPIWLCEIVDKLLAKKPEDRFQTAEEVAKLLGDHLAHLQQPDSVPQPAPIRMKETPSRISDETQDNAAIRVRRLSPWKNKSIVGFIALAVYSFLVWWGFDYTEDLAHRYAPSTYSFRDGTPQGIGYPLEPRSKAYQHIHAETIGNGRSQGTRPMLPTWPREKLTYRLVPNEGPQIHEGLTDSDLFASGQIEIDLINGTAFHYRDLDGSLVTGNKLTEADLLQWMKDVGVNVETPGVKREAAWLYDTAEHLRPGKSEYEVIGKLVDEIAFRSFGVSSSWDIKLAPWVEPTISTVWMIVWLLGSICIGFVVYRSGAEKHSKQPKQATSSAQSDVTEVILPELEKGLIPAIRTYREQTGAGLSEAKLAVEEIARENHIEIPTLSPRQRIKQVAVTTLIVAVLAWAAATAIEQSVSTLLVAPVFAVVVAVYLVFLIAMWRGQRTAHRIPITSWVVGFAVLFVVGLGLLELFEVTRFTQKLDNWLENEVPTAHMPEDTNLTTERANSDQPLVELAMTWTDSGNRWPVLDVDVSADGTWLASGHRGGKMILWEVSRKGESRLSFPYQGDDSNVQDVAFSHDGRFIAWVQYSGRLRLRPASNTQNTEMDHFERMQVPLRSLAWANDSKTIVTGSQGKLFFWDHTQDRKPIMEVDVPGGGMITCVGYTPDGSQLVTGGSDGRVFIWDVTGESPKIAHEVIDTFGKSPAHSGEVHSLSFTPNGKYVISTGDDGKVQAWDLNKADGAWSQHTTNQDPAIFSSAVSPDGKVLCWAGANRGLIRLFNVDFLDEHPLDDALAAPDERHTDDITSLNFTPDGRYLISGSEDGTIKWWEFKQPLINPSQTDVR